MVICAYNAGPYLRPSILSAIGQTYPNLEILVVDDGSTDGSMDTITNIRDERLRILHQRNHGKSVALNRALGELRGEFYAIQDADDESHPERIETQVRCMLENPDVAAVFCGHDLILDGRRVAPLFAPKTKEECRQDSANFRMPAHDPTAMFRVKLVAGEQYREDVRIGQGLDYILRVGEKHAVMVCGRCLYSYRVNRASVTRRDPAVRDKYVREVVTAACERRGVPLEQGPEFLRGARSAQTSSDPENNLAGHFVQSVVDQKRAGELWRAIQTGFQCSALYPLRMAYHKALVLSLVPVFAYPVLRRSERRGRAEARSGRLGLR